MKYPYSRKLEESGCNLLCQEFNAALSSWKEWIEKHD